MKTEQDRLLDRQLKLIKTALPNEYEELAELVAQIDKLETVETAKTNFLAFAKAMWPGMLIGAHHKQMAQVIEGIVLGKEKRAIVNQAPRTSKSEFFSYLMPAWYLGHHPSHKIIQICGTADMAIGWSRKVRNLVASEEYQRIFPGVGLRQDSKAAGRWHTSHGGEYFAVGAEGNVTGKGGDCFVAGTLVSTPKGDEAIETLRVGDAVIAFDLSRGEVVTNRVVATRRLISEKPRVRIRFASGRAAECTADHRFYVAGRGYIPAGELGPRDWLVDRGARDRAAKGYGGAELHDLRSGNLASTVRCQEGAEKERRRFVLWECVLRGRSRDEELKPEVSALRQETGKTPPLVLFGGLQGHRPGREARGSLEAILPELRQGFRREEEILFVGLRESRALPAYDGCWQFALQGQFAAVSVLDAPVQGDVGGGEGARRISVRIVRDAGLEIQDEARGAALKDRDPSSGRGPAEQRAGKSDLPVQLMPQEASSWGVVQVEQVEWLGNEPVEVYDIQVEGQSNFFAEGVLAHNCIIIDDPTGEQQAVAALGDPSVYSKVYSWYTAGPRQRLQPGGRIAVVQSRWAVNDFSGQLLDAERRADGQNIDHWTVVELPIILPSGLPLWPEFWSLDELERTRMSLPPQRWQAQYMQKPSSDHSAILKREWWQRWRHTEPPQCSLKLMTMDTAFSDKQSADYSACTTWGLFNGNDRAGKELPCLILLDAWKERLTFPDLKAAAHKYYIKWQPDIFVVEAKASGAPLIYELRARGIPVSEYTPTRGSKLNANTKIMRANSVSDIMASGVVYAPEGFRTSWADEVIEECASFPGAENDDWVDCVIMALMRFRQGGLIQLASDSWDSEPMAVRKRAYY